MIAFSAVIVGDHDAAALVDATEQDRAGYGSPRVGDVDVVVIGDVVVDLDRDGDVEVVAARARLQDCRMPSRQDGVVKGGVGVAVAVAVKVHVADHDHVNDTCFECAVKCGSQAA